MFNPKIVILICLTLLAGCVKKNEKLNLAVQTVRTWEAGHQFANKENIQPVLTASKIILKHGNEVFFEKLARDKSPFLRNLGRLGLAHKEPPRTAPDDIPKYSAQLPFETGEIYSDLERLILNFEPDNK